MARGRAPTPAPSPSPRWRTASRGPAPERPRATPPTFIPARPPSPFLGGPRLSRRKAPPTAPAPAALALALALALLAPALPLAQAQEGQSLGITPPNVEVAGAQRGQSYQRTVTVQNQFDTPTVLTVEPLGAAGAWTASVPGTGHEVPPRTSQPLTLTIAVPADAANGVHTGFLRIVAEPKGQPDGSGFALRYAVAVVLNITVGGEAIVNLRGVDARAEDVEAGHPPVVAATMENLGNVRAAARATAEVLDAATRASVPGALGTGEVPDVRPGQQVEVPLAFPAALPPGTYLARVRSPDDAGFERVVEFKVVPPGSLGKKGELRALEHEPWVQAGHPVKVVCRFANTGPAAIAGARCSGEVLLDGRLVGVFESPALVVAPGAIANLTAYATPDRAGTYTLVAKVTYDGFESRPNESLLNVQGGAASPGGGGFDPFLLGLALIGIAVVAAVAALRRRRSG